MSQKAKSQNDLEVKVEAFGPTTEGLAEIGKRVLALARVQKYIGHSNARLLYVEVLDLEDKEAKPGPPTHFRATLYDDLNKRTILVDGRLRDLRGVKITESGLAPHPSNAEFAAAAAIVRGDDALAAAMDTTHIEVYQPIPAMVVNELPDGRNERLLTVGLMPRDGGQHEIVGVDLAQRSVMRFDERAPANARPPNRSTCGVTHDAGQSTAGKGTAGMAWVTITQGGQAHWKFLAVRPAASSGTNGSGIELRFVDYKGKRVLYRAHVPILNVKYDADACGPFRDWQYEEGMIDATGADVAPGFRLCPTPAQTILETGNDSGNFLGVGVYVQGNEVVFVSEMQAGWYRYVSEWFLHSNGTLRPRFAFAAVESPCVCNVHHHHVYWRLDFDIRTIGNNRVQEFNDPPLFGNSQWHDKLFEIRRPRDKARSRKWRVVNTVTKEGYEIVPNDEDGLAAEQPDWSFGRGDVWILRYHGGEIDDGVVAIGPPYEADIDRWVNGEAIDDHDVVVWYGAHFTHDVNREGPA